MDTSQTYTSNFPTDSNTSPLRIIFDTSLLATNVDPQYTCYQVGQTVEADNDAGATIPQYSCTTNDILSGDGRNLVLNKLLPQAQATFENALKVMPVQGNLFLGDNPIDCGARIGAPIPSSYTRQGAGVANADIVIFVTSRPIPPTTTTSKTLAFGAYCLEDQFGRPIAGQLNFNPAGISTDDFDLQTQLKTAIHESSHVLGFSITKFQNIYMSPGVWGDATTNASIPSGAGGVTLSKIVINTPNVQKFTRDYFACDTMVGAEIEDGGGTGTKLSHWEKRVWMNEYMTGSSTHNPVFSALTLAFFEDSGWYKANYSYAEQMYWGAGLGCSFSTGPCSSWPTEGYFCAETDAIDCTFDRQAKGVCGLRQPITAVPTYYEYLNSGLIGPSDLADECPYFVAPTNSWCTDTEYSGGTLNSLYGEVYGPSSRCFTSSLVKDVPVSPSSSYRCYPTACLSSTELRVNFDDLWYDCPSGRNIKISGYGGSLLCPSTGVICDGAAEDDSWPRFTSLTPGSGGPGTVVTITGSGFVDGTTVTIHDATDVSVISASVITAKILDSTWFDSPSRAVNEDVDVVITTPNGKSVVVPDGFEVNVKLSPQKVLLWFRANWIPVGAVGLAIVIAVIVCIYCCKKNRKAEKERELQVFRAEEEMEVYPPNKANKQQMQQQQMQQAQMQQQQQQQRHSNSHHHHHHHRSSPERERQKQQQAPRN
eukprot:TRINITY_DN1431_c0_g2_i1.p1 TRINITY_DN1431_c0_g2~~TRINITY_DN1431_c0_g2_i1.p1  ORF type:complete len:772 (+),score=119.03 TRINITY_DN1431_c0_g2_i1:195-2318(+)